MTSNFMIGDRVTNIGQAGWAGVVIRTWQPEWRPRQITVKHLQCLGTLDHIAKSSSDEELWELICRKQRKHEFQEK